MDVGEVISGSSRVILRWPEASAATSPDWITGEQGGVTDSSATLNIRHPSCLADPALLAQGPAADKSADRMPVVITLRGVPVCCVLSLSGV